MGLHFNDVVFHYGQSRHGIDQLSLNIAKGELLAVIGASGSGKSTLLRLVAGLLRQQSGHIVLDGHDLTGVEVHKRNIGMVFQHYALFPHLSLQDNVAYGLKMRGISRDESVRRAGDMLAMVDLAEMAQRLPHQISGGQQQRVALARALAYRPSALLLDEPLSALDVNIRGYLRDQIKVLQREFGATTLMVTHDQEEALAIADRIAVMEGGRLLQVATPQELYERPVNRAVAGFVGHSTILPGRVVSDGIVDVGFQLLLTDTGKLAVGTQVWLLIRPECISVAADPRAPNCIEGELSTVRYLGATKRYDFFPRGSAAAILGEGADLPAHRISIKPEDIYLLQS